MTTRAIQESDVSWGSTGLVPAVVQDVADGRVLMVAYVDPEALAATLASGEIHFHSRSRGRLWRKGETSGNVLRLVGIEVDCDGDALLIQASPVGPTCHRGTRSCFDATESAGGGGLPTAGSALAGPAGTAAPLPAQAQIGEVSLQPETSAPQGFAWLENLWSTIDARATADPAASYTARLVAAGVDAPARKVAEEATEVLMAAKDDAVAADDRRPATRDALTGEVADLLYHVLVLLRERDLPPALVLARLQERHKP
jgi:phosphoribosyl-AMP cyclohydrolase / phosphoribosyl-ATP pyrophosphohydrolase